MHRCPALDCARMIEDTKLACAQHWRLVPEPLRSLVYARWKARRRTGKYKEIREHQAACRAAVQEMNNAILDREGQ